MPFYLEPEVDVVCSGSFHIKLSRIPERTKVPSHHQPSVQTASFDSFGQVTGVRFLLPLLSGPLAGEATSVSGGWDLRPQAWLAWRAAEASS